MILSFDLNFKWLKQYFPYFGNSFKFKETNIWTFFRSFFRLLSHAHYIKI